MLAMEEVLCELSDHEKRKAQGFPPGFRFHPTDEELITFYLASKVFNESFSDVKFVEVDLNRCEPWELPEVAKMGEREWYLYSVRDRKYPTGLRTNRATGAGYWKATGKDKQVYNNRSSSSNGNGAMQPLLIGMKKTLVFYKGRAPRGEKTKWVMHEYRLDGHFSLLFPHSRDSSSSSTKEEWVICRIFHKCGEKRTPPSLLQVQGAGGPDHMDFPSSTTTTTTTKEASLPALLASPTSFTLELDYSQSQSQLMMMIHQQKQNDNISHSHQQQLFPFHHSLQPPNFPNHPSSDQLFFNKSQQNSTLNYIKVKDETAVSRVTKAEATTFFPNHHLLDDPNNSLHWVEKLNPSSFHQNSNNIQLDHNMDAGMVTFSSGTATVNAQVRDMSSSIMVPFNRAGLQQILDASIGIESWPHPQHV